MYNQEQLQAKLRPLVGFRTFGNDEDVDIDSDLQISKSGWFVDGIHPLLGTNILASANGYLERTFPDWTQTATYKVGDVVLYQTKVYRAITISQGVTPGTDDTTWVRSSRFSQWLRDTREAAIKDVLDRFRDGKQNRSLQGNTALFRREGLPQATEPPQSRFVGYRFTLAKSNMAAVLQRIGLQFAKAQSLTLHLSHSEDGVIGTFTLDYTNPERYQYFDLEEEAACARFTGYYVIGYYESDLIAENRAINSDVLVFQEKHCSSCSHNDAEWRRLWRPFVSVEPVTVEQGLPILSGNFGLPVQKTFGVNLVFSFRCDLTDYLARESNSFVSAIKASLRYHFLKAIIHSPNQNPYVEGHRKEAMDEVLNPDNKDNATAAYDRAIDRLITDFSKADSLCQGGVSHSGSVRVGVI